MKVYKMDSQKTCTRCKAYFEDFGGRSIGIGTGQDANGVEGWLEVICPSCDMNEMIHEYKTTGELRSALVLDAVLAKVRLVEFNGDNLHKLWPYVVDHYRKNRAVLLEVADKSEQIGKRGREWEEKHWLGKLQEFYIKSDGRGHSAQTESYKALLWGSAGRVMLTLQDRYPQGNPESKFNGAWVTLIFDETSDTCRGGIQGYCGTFDEIMGLLDTAYDNFPTMKRDDGVTLLGLG